MNNKETLKVTLYTGPQCHLCEQAKQLIGQCKIPNIAVNIVDISRDKTLYQRFRYAIPVIERASDQRLLGWPFDQIQLTTFLEN